MLQMGKHWSVPARAGAESSGGMTGMTTAGSEPWLKFEDWDRMIDVNLKGVLYGIAAVLPHMKAQCSGHIINVSSVAGHKVRAAPCTLRPRLPCG